MRRAVILRQSPPEDWCWLLNSATRQLVMRQVPTRPSVNAENLRANLIPPSYLCCRFTTEHIHNGLENLQTRHWLQILDEDLLKQEDRLALRSDYKRGNQTG